MVDNGRDERGRFKADYLLHVRLERLFMRSINAGSMYPWKYMTGYYDETCAFVMVIMQNSKAVMIEDDPNLFPSDALITQIQLLVTTQGNPKE